MMQSYNTCIRYETDDEMCDYCSVGNDVSCSCPMENPPCGACEPNYHEEEKI